MGIEPLTIYGNPLVMMRYSDLFAQFTESLSTLKDPDPLHLSKDTEDNLFGLLRVWLHINGILHRYIDYSEELPPLRLLAVWHWIADVVNSLPMASCIMRDTFGVDLNTKSMREYIYSVVDHVSYFSLSKETGDAKVELWDYDQEKRVKLSPSHITILSRIVNNFSRIENLCESNCKEDCGCDFDCSYSKRRADIMRLALDRLLEIKERLFSRSRRRY